MCTESQAGTKPSRVIRKAALVHDPLINIADDRIVINIKWSIEMNRCATHREYT